MTDLVALYTAQIGRCLRRGELVEAAALVRDVTWFVETEQEQERQENVDRWCREALEMEQE